MEMKLKVTFENNPSIQVEVDRGETLADVARKAREQKLPIPEEWYTFVHGYLPGVVNHKATSNLVQLGIFDGDEINFHPLL